MKRLVCLLLAILLMTPLAFGCKKTEPKETKAPETTAATEPAPTEPEEPLQPRLGTSLSVYPVYANLTEEEKLLWDNICTAIENYSTERIPIGTYSGVAVYGNAQKRFGQFYRELVFSNPDYFWVNLYEYELHTVETEKGRRLELELFYILDKETAMSYKETYDAKVNEIVTGAKEQEDLFHQVLYAYDAIMAGAEYDYDLADSETPDALNLSAYGCLVNGKTVCSGYAMAFLTVMEKLGIECGLEFSTYQHYSIFVGHVWNYCKLDGEYYYFDPTWDDTGYGNIPSLHLYFGLNKEDMAMASHYINDNPLIPECTGTKYNYYRYLDMSFPVYDYDAVKAVIQEHRNDSVIVLRFDSREEAQKAQDDLIDNDRIFDILTNVRRVSYWISDTDRHFLIMPD